MAAHRDIDAELASPKYAHIERERRWLVDRHRRPTLGNSHILIEDRYLEGTRLRLRRMSDANQSWTSLKLTKKYETDEASERPVVTAYLSVEEYIRLAALAGHAIVKRRYDMTHDGMVWSLDHFIGPLEGLEILEIEADDQALLQSLVPPRWATREITHEPLYQCGSLAQTMKIPE